MNVVKVPLRFKSTDNPKDVSLNNATFVIGISHRYSEMYTKNPQRILFFVRSPMKNIYSRWYLYCSLTNQFYSSDPPDRWMDSWEVIC